MTAKPFAAALAPAICAATLLVTSACSDKSAPPEDKAVPAEGAVTSTVTESAPATSDIPATKSEDSATPAPDKGTKADAATGIRSVYSSIKGSACKTIASNDEAEYREQKCTGVAGTPLYIKEGDLRADIDAGAMGEFLTPGPFNAASDTVEWRVGPDGQPFAIIFRLTSDVPGQPKQSWLMVETVGKGGKPGCRLAEIPGATHDANKVARDKADAAEGGKAKCMTY